MTDTNEELSAIDSKAEMQKFMDAIRERAKSLPPHCVEHTKPDVAAKAMWLLAQGAPYTEIRRITRLDHETIRRLEWDHTSTLEEKRKQFSTRYAMAAMEYTDLLFKKAEQLSENPEQLALVQPDKLATVVGIMQDKASQLAGVSSSEVDKKSGLSIEDARALIEAASQRIASKKNGTDKVIEAEVME